MPTTPNPGRGRRPYHHGDLRRVLLRAAVEAVLETGPATVNLRDLARRAGVSHATPADHFGDKAGLLTAIAADGCWRLAAALRQAHEATGSVLEIGVAYAGFAVTHRAYFEVMFRPRAVPPRRPRGVARPPSVAVAAVRPAGRRARSGPRRAAHRRGRLVAGPRARHPVAQPRPATPLGDDPEPITREVARYLFQPRGSTRPSSH
jgi:AcrR family transcriptional regulator